MTDTNLTPARARLLRFGFLGDAVFKLFVAVAYLIWVEPLSRILGTPDWLLIVTSVALLISTVPETHFALYRVANTHVRYLAIYDVGWALATVSALGLAAVQQPCAGEFWLAFQCIGSLILTVLFARGSRKFETSSV